MINHTSKMFGFMLLSALLCSCGKQHKAESAINEFLDKNLVESDYSASVSGVDSTSYVTDSMINVMRTDASRNRHFKLGISYGYPSSNVYVYAKTVIIIGKDTLKQTYYLDRNMNDVIAFKGI